MSRTGDYLLAGIKRRGIVPATQALFVDADFFTMVDDIVMGTMLPLIVSLREDYFVKTTNVASVANQAEYDIPYRAIGRSLRDLKLVDGSSTKDMTLIPLEDEHMFKSSSTPQSFYFKGDQIVIVPYPTVSTLYFQMWWLIQPSALTAETSAAKVSTISDPTVTCTSVPATIVPGVKVDFIRGTAGAHIYSFDATVTNVSGTQITFGAGVVPSNLQAGDYIALAQTSPIIMLPDECYPYLETVVAQQMLRSLGDHDGAAVLDDTAKAQEKAIKLLLEPRIVGEEKKVLNRNSLLRGYRSRFRYGWLVR